MYWRVDAILDNKWRNKPKEECPDGHRYKVLGNSMAVPVVEWIGKRLINVHNKLEGHNNE